MVPVFAQPLPPDELITIKTVCLCICLSASISLEPLNRSSQNFVCRSPLALAWFSSGDVAIRYVLSVLWMRSCCSVMGRTCMTGVESDVCECLLSICTLFDLLRCCFVAVCKSCVVKYLQSSKCCPQCGLKIHETQPLLNLKSDRVMQDIVFKLVPGLYESELHSFYLEMATLYFSCIFSNVSELWNLSLVYISQ